MILPRFHPGAERAGAKARGWINGTHPVARAACTLAAILCALPLTTKAAAAPLNPNDPPDGRFVDDWAEVYMAGGKVGYLHSTMARDGGLIHTRVLTKMRVGRAAQPVEIETVQATTETVGGVPVRFSFEMGAAAVKTSMRGEVENGRVRIVNTQYGLEQRRTFDFPAGALMAWGMFRESLLRGFAPETQYTLQTYLPEMRLDGPVTAITTVDSWESFEHRGHQRRGQKVRITLEAPTGAIDIVSWVDREGRPLKSVVPAPGLGDMELITTDQATALADFVPPEVFLKTMIQVDRAIKPRSCRRIRYRIRSTHPAVELEELPTGGMQTVAKHTGESVELVVTRQSHQLSPQREPAGHDGKRPAVLRADELAEYLESNLMINTADPRLVALARRAGGGETDAYALADKLRRFVSEYVTTKSLNIGFATASEVCRTREGDCSEHSVLLAAIGRLNGLPSRVVVGVAYVPSLGGRSNVFGYHMWTQFYIDGRWVDLDAALNESVCSPTRIAFAASSLKHTGLADLSLPLLPKIGAIDIDILEVEEMPGLRP